MGNDIDICGSYSSAIYISSGFSIVHIGQHVNAIEKRGVEVLVTLQQQKRLSKHLSTHTLILSKESREPQDWLGRIWPVTIGGATLDPANGLIFGMPAPLPPPPPGRSCRPPFAGLVIPGRATSTPADCLPVYMGLR